MGLHTAHASVEEMMRAGKGRGAPTNPVNRFETLSLHVLPERTQEIVSEGDEPGCAPIKTIVYADRSRTVLNRVDSPDLPMEWTLNPYRGCEHGCVYCYARPGHEFLGLSSGLDFEARIIAKHDAAALLRAELMKPSWRGETIALSGVTDPYQPVEQTLRITRSILEVAVEFRQPLSLITKSRRVVRDLDLMQRLHEHRAVSVALSITTLDPHLSAIMEPRAASPNARLDAMRTLADAGIPVHVMTAPIIPGINDHELPALLSAARRAGARAAGYVLLRLPHQNKAIFEDWLHRHCPERAQKVLSLMRQCHGGALYRSDWRERQRGSGPVAEMIASSFKVFAKREGLAGGWREGPRESPFRRPDVAQRDGQGVLYGEQRQGELFG